MDKNARRRLRYIERVLERLLEGQRESEEYGFVPASEKEPKSIRVKRLIDAVPYDENRAARLWEIRFEAWYPRIVLGGPYD